MDLVREIYAAAAREARAVGIHQLFTLVVEPIRDPRLGRNQEAFSEDPYLCSRIAEIDRARGAGRRRLGAGQGRRRTVPLSRPEPAGASGLERGAMEISERTLREVFLPPWVAGIKKAGALGVMATYPAIDGVPTHASEKILTRILREELGFDGLVLGEGGGIGTLVYERLAANQKEAGILALKAGLDVGISYEPGYMKPLVESVEEGQRPDGRDRPRGAAHPAAEVPRWDCSRSPTSMRTRAAKLVHRAPHQDLALQAAREGIVLLKNEKNLLPLAKSLVRSR